MVQLFSKDHLSQCVLYAVSSRISLQLLCFTVPQILNVTPRYFDSIQQEVFKKPQHTNQVEAGLRCFYFSDDYMCR